VPSSIGRRVACWRGDISNTLTTDFCIDAVREAIKTYGLPEIFNTDQGSQFTDKDFVALIRDENGIALSMDGKGAWRDNVFVERFWKSLKYEEVYLHAYESVSEAKSGIGKYIAFYNGLRPLVPRRAHAGCRILQFSRRCGGLTLQSHPLSRARSAVQNRSHLCHNDRGTRHGGVRSKP
jgi:transposase InsO family protein